MATSAQRLFRPSHVDKGPGIHDPSGFLTRLGLAVRNREELVAKIRSGLPVAIIDKLGSELALPKQALLKLIALPSATLARRRAQKRLSPQESDRIYRVANVYALALRLFEGDAGAARGWLGESAKALGGGTPLQQLDTEAGADGVRNLIGRLEHGVVS